MSEANKIMEIELAVRMEWPNIGFRVRFDAFSYGLSERRTSPAIRRESCGLIRPKKGRARIISHLRSTS